MAQVDPDQEQDQERDQVEVLKQPNGIADIDRLLNARVITFSKWLPNKEKAADKRSTQFASRIPIQTFGGSTSGHSFLSLPQLLFAFLKKVSHMDCVSAPVLILWV